MLESGANIFESWGNMIFGRLMSVDMTMSPDSCVICLRFIFNMG